jgi:hypothetical protein
MHRLVSGAVGLALVIAAGVVIAVEPPEEIRQAPIEILVGLGERGIGRNIDVTYLDVRLAKTVTADAYTPWIGTTEGTWVVIDLEAATVLEPSGVHSWLLIDGLLIEGSTRADQGGMEDNVVSPGMTVAGSILFEIPDDVLDATSARVVTSMSSDWRLDSSIAMTFDPSSLSPAATVSIVSPALVPR